MSLYTKMSSYFQKFYIAISKEMFSWHNTNKWKLKHIYASFDQDMELKTDNLECLELLYYYFPVYYGYTIHTLQPQGYLYRGK